MVYSFRIRRRPEPRRVPDCRHEAIFCQVQRHLCLEHVPGFRATPQRSLPTSCCMWLRMAHAPPSYYIAYTASAEAAASHRAKISREQRGHDIIKRMSRRAFGQLGPFDALLCEDLAQRLRGKAPPPHCPDSQRSFSISSLPFTALLWRADPVL